MKDVSLYRAKILKHELEASIRKLIMDFTEETGLNVSSVNIDNCEINGYEDSFTINTEVKL